MAACIRSQNSYNSGVWLDYKVETPEDQQRFILPLNSLSEKIYYNQRFLIDTKVDVNTGSEPRAWRITKINRIAANGTVLATCAQDQFNQHDDYVEYLDPNDPSTIVGMWADYFKEPITPQEPTENTREDALASITCVGKKELKCGGSYKKLTVQFTKDGEPAEFISGAWSFYLDGVDVQSLIDIQTFDNDPNLKENQIKIKFIGSEDYIGQILTVEYATESGIQSSLQLKIGGL